MDFKITEKALEKLLHDYAYNYLAYEEYEKEMGNSIDCDIDTYHVYNEACCRNTEDWMKAIGLHPESNYVKSIIEAERKTFRVIDDLDGIVFVDSQIAKLREGLNALINVDFDTDQFIVTAACEYWVDKYIEARKDSFPEEIPDMKLVDHTRDICNKICGKYTSLEEINQMMEKYFVPGTWEVMA